MKKLYDTKERKLQETRIDKNIKTLREKLRYYSMFIAIITIILCSYITSYNMSRIVSVVVAIISYIDIIDYVYLRSIKYKMYNNYNQKLVNVLCDSIENKRFRLSKSYYVVMFITYTGIYLSLVTIIENYL